MSPFDTQTGQLAGSNRKWYIRTQHGVGSHGGSEMKRAVLICAVLAAISPTYAEAADRIWRMGVLALADNGAVRSFILPYLATRGFVEGRNLVVNVRVGAEEQMPELARALVGDKPDAIIAISDWALYATRAATSTIPIVAAPMGDDPLPAAVADSCAHPAATTPRVPLPTPHLPPQPLSLLHQ